MRRRSFLALVAAPALRAQQPSGDKPELDRARAIEDLLSAEMAKRSIPGLSAAAAWDGRMQWAEGLGLADLENFVPARDVTAYRTASIAKPITAVAAMQLVESGKLDLDAPIQNWVPAFPKKPWTVTLRQLLGHLGGIRWYRGGEFTNTRYFRSLTEAVAQFANDDLEAEPGTRYIYSSFGYVLAGAAVEAAAGMPFEEVLRFRVFGPAGMASTRLDSVRDVIPHRARGYVRTESGAIVNSALTDTSNRVPGGGLVSTAPDLVRFALALSEGKLLKPASLEVMWTPQRTRDGRSTGYGLGWGIGDVAGRRSVSHDGGQSGVSTRLVLLPEQRAALSVLCNLEGLQLGQLTDAATAALLA